MIKELKKNMVIWSLFDSGNGSYFNTLKDMDNIENFSVGLDRENKNSHFINLNLADYSALFGKDNLLEELSKLPKPDLIIASPPCESWSVASSMSEGNACWKQQRHDSLFAPQTPLSKYTIREYKDYTTGQFKPEKSLMTRINGELTIFNTIKIIKHFEPTYYVIENPAYGRIWEYIDKILGFDIPFENLTYYNNYDYPIVKPTKFGSNINLNLKKDKVPPEKSFNDIHGYNARSNIPQKLVSYIFETIYKDWKNNNLEENIKEIELLNE